jgi:AraC-like DNA-binding protein
MMKKYVFALLFFGSLTFTAKGQDNDLFQRHKHLSSQQLIDTADYYFNKWSLDTALIFYNFLINATQQKSDIEHQKRVAEAYNTAAIIYYQYISDYRTAYEHWVKALILSEEIGHTSLIPRIYNNIGNIYFYFKNYDVAKSYYLNSLNLLTDSAFIVAALVNLGATELKSENKDSAFYYLHKALPISKQYNNRYLHIIQGNIALYYERIEQYDSAFYYYHISSDEAERQNDIKTRALNLSNLSNLFFKTNQIDSALLYLDLSNSLANDHNFLDILAENYLAMSKIERFMGDKDNALLYFEKYITLKDSVSNVEVFGEINQLQRLYEVSKMNQQIEQLAIEQQIRSRIIHYLIAVLIVLGLLCVALLINFFQKRKLDTAYKVLVEKNIEIVDFQKSPSEKYKKSTLSHDKEKELLDKIFALMENTSIICETAFSVDKLAELTESNRTYVSQVINSVLKKNFRSFLNSYRIQEAQRLFSEPDARKYTIESVALKVGFESQSAFRDAFKEIVGVSPSFYLKSVLEQNFAENY